MAPRILSLYCLIILASLIDCRAGGSLKLSLGFSILSPPEVVALRNHPLLLNCSGYSDEGPLRISWRFQDADIKDKHFLTFPNGSLSIDRLISPKKRDGRWDGNYTCVLRNNVGVLVSRPINVILARMSKNFIVEPQPLALYEGGQARFSCQINAVPPATISWYKDGIELPQNNSRYTVLPSGTLQITRVTVTDEGSYKCRCSNVARQRDSSEATLTVLSRSNELMFEPPVIVSPNEEVIAVSGQSAVLECLAMGFPKVEYFWKREDAREIVQSYFGEGNLFLPKVTPQNDGSYICTAKVLNKDTGQEAEATKRVYLRVYVPPKFSKVPVSQMIPTSQTVRFDCEVESTPASSIFWMKDGEHIYINGRIKLKAGNTLVVSHTVTSDSGIYQCVAMNAAGANTFAARLLVNAPNIQPSPPSGLKAVTKSSSAILLSWDPVYSPASSPIQAYTVHYMPTSGGIEQNAVAENTSLLIERLKPFTNYSFYVRAYTNKSASEPSQPIVQITGETVPAIAPKVTLSSISPTVLHIQWNELPIEKTRGIVTSHRIYYRKHNQASYHIATINSGTEHTLTGLTPKQKYDVRVLAGTKAGFPTFSDEHWPWVVFEMPDRSTSKVPSAPVLHLTVINSTTLEVEWSMPSDNSYPVTGFYLSYRQQNMPLKRNITLPANITKYHLFDLAPQTWYEVHLVAFNKNGDSQESVRNIITISGDNPDAETVEVVEPPHQLEAEPMSSTSIHLTWQTPITNRNISYYTVRYHPVFSSGLVNESCIYYIRSTNNEVLLTDLKPFTLYEFSVRSHDAHKRQGPFSQTVECRTMEEIPSPPNDISWAPVDANSVRLNWQSPKHPNGIITAFYILYSTHVDNDLDTWNSKQEKGTETTSLLSGLSSNTLYYLCMKARNGAGLSEPSPIVAVNIPVRHNNSKFPSQEMFDADPPDPFLGIVLGISIGVGCIIICAVIIICRNRCAPPVEQGSEGRYSVCCGNGYIPHLNGHLMSNMPSDEKRSHAIESQEMDCFTPMLNTFSNGSNDRHLDTKGGYPTNMCNGRANGIPHQHTGNSRSSLGSHPGSVGSAQHLDHDQGQRPTAKQRKRYSSNDCKIADSSWPDESADITSSTVLLESENPTLSESVLAEAASSPSQEEPPSSSGAKENSNIKSSCITDSVPESTPETQCTVPLLSPASPLLSDSDQKCMPSRESSPSGVEDASSEAHSQPFSVNAFLSPLPGPRFPQSSSMDSAQKPT